MMCLSNYDLGLAGVDDDVRAGAGKAYISIRKLNCKLKWPSMFKKPCFKGKQVQQKTESGRICATKLDSPCEVLLVLS